MGDGTHARGPGRFGTQLIEALDQDGAEPDDDRPPVEVNELHLTSHGDRPGGTIRGRLDSRALYDAIATFLDAHSKPLTADDDRAPATRRAEAVADVCSHGLDSGRAPQTGGVRPHLAVIVRLADLEARARGATLDFGGNLSPAALRALACDAAVVPVVLGGPGQPLDVGRATRTIPDGLRRAVMRHAGMGELEKLAREAGMRTMYEDGIGKALQGLTTIEEVLRVTEDA